MGGSFFIQIFGDYPSIKVLDFLMENYMFDYSKAQIAELSGVSFNTLETFWVKLEGNGIIKKTRMVGKSQMYQMDRDSPVSKMLLEIDKKLILDSISTEEPAKIAVRKR
ncbi:hypothetical protein A3K63_01975 [Candidatus Micrarchaeota archaeon RBG_16_49_10]|nr:MAG: hypothetical protein A3K63_01975 [Candidatus Micrarchaeota archaeon RBG_16_49_10]